MSLASNKGATSNELGQVSLYCAREGEVWRVYVEAKVLPPYLDRYFDAYGEAYPALLDFDDLEPYMAAHAAVYRKHVTATGSVELSAHGAAAVALSEWLSRAFSSCVRPRKK
jgi:hypothetical protein